MAHDRTSWYGGVGTALTTIAPFVPPPFTVIPLALGAVITGLGFYFAADKDDKHDKNVSFSTVKEPWVYKSPKGFHE